jgi:fructoselysine-6-P-deglycase FrlB-like protein
MALAAAGIAVLVFRPDGTIAPSIDEAIDGMRRRGAQPWVIGGREVDGDERALALPIDLPEALTPLALALPGQLLADAAARARGLSPDTAFGLRKVTRTR